MATDTDYRASIAAKILFSESRSFESYFKVYDALFSRCDYRALQIESPGPQDATPTSHEDILTAAEMLRENPRLKLEEAVGQLQTRLPGSRSTHQLRHAIYVAVRAMIMLDCVPEGQDSNAWQAEERYTDFVDRYFPQSTHAASADNETGNCVNRNALKAWKLKARFGMSFRGTDTLSQHLTLDTTHADGPTLYLFHHTSFLKAQLECLARKGYGKNDNVATCLASGFLAPRLLAETLHSLQDVLFRFDDDKSQNILRRLISKRGFDEDSALAEGYKIFDSAQDLDYYRYFGSRLTALDNFMQGRPPKNRFERWMKWQTSESNAFAVALAALLISLIVGILTLGVSGFQAWVAWKAWKEPVSDSGGISISLEELLEWAEAARRP